MEEHSRSWKDSWKIKVWFFLKSQIWGILRSQNFGVYSIHNRIINTSEGGKEPLLSPGGAHLICDCCLLPVGSWYQRLNLYVVSGQNEMSISRNSEIAAEVAVVKIFMAY